MGYYSIARLRRGSGVVINGFDIDVDLDAIGHDDRIDNDVSLIAARDVDSYFYVSGGGSLLLGGRHLLVVRREADARVNPGRLSLFTGRADNSSEWESPWMVVRELFEELVLFADGEMLYPRCRRFQAIIDTVYSKAERGTGSFALNLIETDLSTGTLKVRRAGRTVCEMQSFCHINSQNDINLLFLFEADLDLGRITAIDGESGSGLNCREIGALDLETMEYTDLSGSAVATTECDASRLPMTEHLEAMICAIKRKRA